MGTSLENSVTYTVDKLNRTLTQNDPDHGTYNYTYDALGQTTEEISPKLAQTSDSISFQYDLLGRMTSRTEPEGTTTWAYDNTTGGNLGVGQIHSQSQTGFSRTYSYASTDYGRLTSVSTTIGSDTYTSTQTYNANGQGDTFTYPASYSYPTGLQVQNTYNALGYLERVQNPTTSEVYYQYLDSDATGRMTQQWLGDGSTLSQGYESHSSRITSQHTTIGATDIQELTYAWDSVGNMSSRSDLINSLTETFTYDNQDRLTQAKVGVATPIDYGYNIIGNIASKSDTGNYSYALVQDHAVSNITQGATSNDYSYDDNGNLSNGDDVPTITWSSYNKPTQLQKSSITYDFSYGPDRLRYKKIHTTTTSTKTTHYLGNNFEQTQEGTDITYRHVIRAGNQAVAILTDDNSGNTDLKYLHRDHLGSITTITDDTGTIIERLSYGPWGQRRDATDWETIISTATDHRGYTGHEHLDDIGIIHMNGRVYSPKLGRMLSPDPVTQSPENGQNYNRYSYVFNNPLRYTDPSGYFSLGIAGIVNIGGFGGFGSFGIVVGGGFSGLGLFGGFLGDFYGDLFGGRDLNRVQCSIACLLWRNYTTGVNSRRATEIAQKNSTNDDTAPKVVGLDFSFGKGISKAKARAFQKVADKYFKNVFPDGHKVDVLIADLGDEDVAQTPDQNTILINSRSINHAPLNILRATFGHELIHIKDHIKHKNMKEGSIIHFESEVRALEWETAHQTDFNYSPQDSGDLADRMVKAQNELKRAKELKKIREQWRQRGVRGRW